MERLFNAICKEIPCINKNELRETLMSSDTETINNLIDIYINKNY